jgi:PIN domain nuclease of toxin-antitoxin system
MLNLDTHVLIHALAGTATAKERRVLADDTWGISDIVLWEVTKLHQLGRIDLDPSDAEFARLLDAIHVWPITLAVARQSARLDFRSDPADEIIAATSIVHGVALVTRDGRIRKSKMVPLARWRGE